jgi:DNA invertase Pin-like site-specific DNA recombinase
MRDGCKANATKRYERIKKDPYLYAKHKFRRYIKNQNLFAGIREKKAQALGLKKITFKKRTKPPKISDDPVLQKLFVDKLGDHYKDGF